MKKPLEYLLAALCCVALSAGLRVYAQPLARGDAHAYLLAAESVECVDGELFAFADGDFSILQFVRPMPECPYIEYLHRPKKTGIVDELLGPIGEVKNGPYAAWTTKIAYLSVIGSLKFQNSSLVKETCRLYPSTYDRYDFVLGQEATRFVTFRLSGDYSMNGMKLLSSDKIAHCYRVGLRPEAVLNKIHFDENGLEKLTVSALAGPELGVMFSLDNWNLQARFYAGVTGAVRLDYDLSDRFCVWFEPRVSYLPYSLRYLSGDRSTTKVGNRFGSVTRLNMGLKISF